MEVTLDHDDWNRMNAVALSVHAAGDMNELIGVVRSGIPEMLRADCRIYYDPAGSGEEAREGSSCRVGMFSVVRNGSWEQREVALLDLIEPHLAVAWKRLAPSEELIAHHPGVAKLTRRQREVLPLFLSGLTHQEIGQELGISHRTVEKHVAGIAQALGYLQGQFIAKNFRFQNDGDGI